MTKTIYTILIAMLLSIPSVCFSSFLIELDNGNEYVTDQYWESDSNIQFNYHGGIVSLSRNTIAAMSTSDKPYFDGPAFVEDVSAVGAKQKPSGMGSVGGDGKESTDSKKQEIDMADYRARNAELKNHLGESLRALRESSRNRDKVGKEYARKMIVEYSSRLYALTDELKKKNNSHLPEDWWEGADDM